MPCGEPSGQGSEAVGRGGVYTSIILLSRAQRTALGGKQTLGVFDACLVDLLGIDKPHVEACLPVAVVVPLHARQGFAFLWGPVATRPSVNRVIPRQADVVRLEAPQKKAFCI